MAARYGDRRLRRHPFTVRLISLTALRAARIDLARLLISQYERGMDDTPDRIGAFERQLAPHHPGIRTAPANLIEMPSAGAA